MESQTLQNLVRVPKDRVPPLLQLINVFLQLKTVTARQFLSLLGKLNAAADYVELGRLHLRPLQMSLLAQSRPPSQITSFSSYQVLSQYLSSSYLVEQSSYLQSRCSNQNTLSFSAVVHRCQSIRLGSSSGTRRNSIS